MPLDASPIIFANNPLDRSGHRRGDDAWMAAQLAHENALFLPLWRLQPLILPPLSGSRERDVGWLVRDAFGAILDEGALIVFLGINRRGKPLFVVDVSHLSSPETSGVFAGLGQFDDLREIAGAGDIAPTELGILAHAKAIIDWHGRHRFCAQCGNESDIAEGGHKRICASCGTEHFPRTDPVVIMLGVYGDKCLVGRQHGWPPNMYSALAGFVEPGETIEEAVAREMHEEAGVDISRVRFLANQPWPFPSSLMIGCIAEAANDSLTLDGIELSDARWVSRNDIQAALRGEGELLVPPAMAIAHHLIVHFAQN